MADSQNNTKKVIKQLTDDEGNPSSMRVMAVFSLVIAAVLALLSAFGLSVNPANNDLVVYFLLGAFGGKTGQKFAENLKTAK